MIVQTADRFTICSAASLIDDGDQLRAWAERHLRKDPDIRWILGNYVEADQANNNGHIFPLDELLNAQATLPHKPLNMMHREHYIVGAFAGAQLLSAEGADIHNGIEAEQAATAATGSSRRPYVEALAGMWHRRFPEEFFNVRRAHSEGTLFYSMEAVPQEVSCPTCSHRTAFAGLEHDTYCDHMQGAVGPKRLHNPNFSGGAVIIPPVKPGWSRADVTAISKMLEENTDLADQAYKETAAVAPHLDAHQWESVMAEVLTVAKEFSTDKRDKLANKGHAMPDGSFPIENVQDLKNAIQAIGRAKNPGAAKAHIKKRARALGAEDLLPEGW